MKDIDKKKEFLEKALHQVEHKRYQPNPYLGTRIKQKLASPSSFWSFPEMAKLGLACLLVVLNIYAFSNVRSNTMQYSENPLAEDYGWNTDDSDFYYLTSE